MEITNMMTDLALMLFPALVIYPLQMPMKTRISLIWLFSARGLLLSKTLSRRVATNPFPELSPLLLKSSFTSIGGSSQTSHTMRSLYSLLDSFYSSSVSFLPA